MDAATKGERYARIFRKAGTFLAKRNLARAIEVFKEGVALAEAEGDARMARHFQSEIDKATKVSHDP